MLHRRDFLVLINAVFLCAPAVSLSQVPTPSAPTKQLRIVVIANTYHEGDGLMAALSMRMPRNPKVGVPHHIVWPRLSTLDREKDKDILVDPRPRALINVTSQTGNASSLVEIWCLDDLMLAAVVHGDSQNKADAMNLIKAYKGPDGTAIFPAPDGVIAFGTAGYPDTISYDGCATIGGTIFIRDASQDNNTPHSNWQWNGHMGVLIPSRAPAKFFSSVLSDDQTIRTINSQMLIPPVNPSSKPRIVIASDAVAVSSVNIPKDTEYGPVDKRAIDAAKEKGATNISSVETTHGVIRAQWEDVPFIFVTAIPNRVGHFTDEARANYAQELSASHNAGIALNHVLPYFVDAIAQ